MFRPVAIDVGEIFIGNLPQAPAQLARRSHRIEHGVIVHDRQDRVDVMLDQLGRHLTEIGCMLDDPAQAFGSRRR